MPRLTSALVLPLWYRALETEIGIGIRTDDRRALQTALYRARDEHNDPDLQRLIMFMPNNDEVWLCKKEVELEP